MDPIYKRFVMFLLLLIIIVAGATILINRIAPQLVTPYWSLLLLFFSLISIAVYFLTIKVKAKNDMGKFTNFYMGTTMTKLLVYLATLLTYIMIFPEDKKSFVCTFLAYYLCFTFFETYFLVKNKN